MRLIMLLLCFISLVYGKTIDEVLKLAEENSPLLKVNLYQVKSLEGNVVQAKVLPNPNLSIEFGRLISQTDSGFAVTSFSIMQNLRLWGDRDLAEKSAKLQMKAQQFFFKDQKLALLSQVYKSFYNALYQKEILRIKEKELETAKQLLMYIEKGYSLGAFTELDYLRAKRDVDIAKANLENQKAVYTQYLAQLSSLIGVEIDDVEGKLSILPEKKEVDINSLPIMKYYTLLEESLDTQIKRQKALAKPQVAVGIVVSEDEVDLGKYDAGVSVNFSVPVFNKNQGQIINLTYRKKSIIEKKNLTKLQFESQLKAIDTRLKTLKEQIRVVNISSLPKVEQSLKIAQKSFKSRVITFFEYNSIQKQYFETLSYIANLYFQYHSLFADYLRLGGKR